jgi:hypothetical protein
MFRILLAALVLAGLAPAQAQEPHALYLPLVVQAGQPEPPPLPPPPIVELTPISAPVPVYRGVQPQAVTDKTGLLWMLLYLLGEAPGSYLATWRPGDAAFVVVSERLSDGPRGSLALGCDGRLYVLLPVEADSSVLAIYRVNSFPGPAQAVVCTPATMQLVGQP